MRNDRIAMQFAAVLCIVAPCFGVCTAFADSPGNETLAAAGVHGGLVVHVGCGDGTRTISLRGSERHIVHGLDTDATDVMAARSRIRALGLYGPITVDVFDGRHLPYIDNLVNLLVADDLGDVAMNEVMRVLAPRGVAMIGGKRIVKPWPDDMDEWTHWLHGADNNAVSQDRQVGVSRSLQWSMPPLSGRHHNLLPSVSAMVSAGARIYYIIDEAPVGVRGPGGRWSLIARDAFNGLVLWKRPMEKWGWQHWSELQVSGLMRFKGPDQLYRRLVAVENVLYATLGFAEPVVAIDGATGETIRTYDGTENTAEILYADGTLFLTRNVLGDAPGKDIVAIDAKSGDKLWEKTGHTGISSRGDELAAYTDSYLTIGDDKVFFLDKDSVVAVDKSTGQEAWTRPRPAMEQGVLGHYRFNFAHFCTLVHHKGFLFLAQIHPNEANLNAWQEKDVTLLALDAESGERLWEHTGMTLAHFTPPDLFIANEMVWTMEKGTVALCGLDLRTGAIEKRYPVKDMLVGHHHRCYRNKATEQFYLAGEEGIEYIRFDSGELDVHHWLRGACGYGLLPANGLIYMPTHACGCHANVKLNGFLALRSGAATDALTAEETRASSPDRLERGPAFQVPTARERGESSAADQWPVYRHDNRRSNHAPIDVLAQLKERWAFSLGGKLTPPIIADRKVFFAATDRNRVVCLDAENGRQQWQFTTDGPVDSPPTYVQGRLVFGTRGGSVYALQPDSGALIWRFQAAPSVDRLMAFSRLESPWPVHGSVLVEDDRVYCVAGRSMHLDSGLFVSVLDLATGQVIQQTRLEADLKLNGELGDAVLPDVLVQSGDDIFMRQMRFEGGDILRRSRAASQEFLRVNDGGLLDTTWINNSFWKYGQMQAQMIAFDGQTAYGIKGPDRLISKSYGQDVFLPGKQGYALYAIEVGDRASTVSDEGRDKRRGKGGSKSKLKWNTRVPVRAQCLVATDRYLFIAGVPDVMDPLDPWAAFDNRKGGLLQVYSKEDGQKLADHQLAVPPVFDGLAAAYGRLYAATTAGQIVCLDGVKE